MAPHPVQNKNSFRNHVVHNLNWGEDVLTLTIFICMAFLPALEAITRLFKIPGIPASPVLVQHLTLWIGFVGAILATRQNKLLALTTKPLFISEDKFYFGRWLAQIVSFLVVVALMVGSLIFIYWEFKYPINIAPNIPRPVAQIIVPLGFAMIGILIFLKSGKDTLYRASFLGMALVGVLIGLTDAFQSSNIFLWFGLIIILIALINGAPIFVGLGGAAVLLFWNSGTSVAAIPAETYRIVVSPTLPTIPLFTLAGYILAESNASKRMLRIFRSLFGWIPGSTPVIVIILSGVFTAMTGGSGVTILALGGLLFPLLREEGYSDYFSIGLITVSGSVGLLFPPSLPAIIYGVTAGVSVKSIFIAGLIPGILIIVLMSAWSIYQGKVQHINKNPLDLKETLKALWETRYELLIPFIILYGVFGGKTTLVEAAAITVIYIIVIEIFIYKDISIKSLPRIIVDCATLIGGVLIILGVAMGLTSYLVDAEIPMHLLEWVKINISGRLVFLLVLNVLLLAVGCLMDIFSAIIVIVPLIAPLGIYFGIDPVHLAIIFISNLELGFLTPPVGMNLFLSAYRFNKDMPFLYKATMPFFAVRLVAVLIITYLPFMFNLY